MWWAVTGEAEDNTKETYKDKVDIKKVIFLGNYYTNFTKIVAGVFTLLFLSEGIVFFALLPRMVLETTYYSFIALGVIGMIGAAVELILLAVYLQLSIYNFYLFSKKKKEILEVLNGIPVSKTEHNSIRVKFGFDFTY